MAKGKGKRRGNDFTYEGDQATRRQAQHLAGALAPSRGSIARPYRESIQDVGGYTKALADLLGGIQGNVSGAYDKARATQEQINAAAQGRLGTLGDYSAGTQAAAGGIGDSSLSALVATGAAAESNAARQPGIAASRGAGQQASLQQAMSDALAARREGIRQSAVSLFAQLKDQGLNRDLQYQGFQEGQRQFNQSQAQQASQFAQSQAQQNAQFGMTFGENQRQFNQSQQQQWKEWKREQQAQSAGGGFTPLQLNDMTSNMNDTITQARRGVPNPNYGGKKPDGTRDNRHWLTPPANSNGTRSDKGGYGVSEVYDLGHQQGYPDWLILNALKERYPPAVFVHFLRGRFPNLANKFYGRRAKSGTSHGGGGRRK